MVITQRLVLCPVRYGLALISAINVASSNDTRVQERLSMILGKVRTRRRVARGTVLIQRRR